MHGTWKLYTVLGKHREMMTRGKVSTWESGSREGILQQLTSLVFHFSQDQLLAHPDRLNLREETFTPFGNWSPFWK